jgi:hypothetical protein
LSLIDVSDVEGPRIVTQWPTKNIALDETGNLVFDLREGLTVTDITDAVNPVEVLTSYEHNLRAGSISVAGGLAFIAGLEGLVILDVGDPGNPVEVGRLTTEWLPGQMSVDGGTALVAVQDEGIRIIDVSNPADPREVGAWGFSMKNRDIVLVDELAYVAFGLDGVRVVDLSEPSAPVEISTFDEVEEAWGLSISGSLCAIAFGKSGFGIYDISNPADPRLLSVYSSDGAIWDVAVSGEIAYVAVGSSTESVPPKYRGDVTFSSEGVFRTVGGFRAVDISDPSRPVERAAFGLRSTVLDVAVRDGLEYFALGDAGVAVGEVRSSAIVSFDPPEELDTPGVAVGITPYEHYALVADLHKGLRIIDVSDPEHLKEIGFIDTPGQANKVVVHGHHAVVADGDGGLRIVDISTPTAPVEIGLFEIPGSAIDVAVARDYAYVAAGEEGLHVIDISTPSQPIEVVIPHTVKGAMAVAVQNDVLGVVSKLVFPYPGELTQFDVFDLSDSGIPDHVSTMAHQFRGEPTDVELSGFLAFVTTRSYLDLWSGGLEIVDFSDPWRLQTVGEWEYTKDVFRVWVDDGRTYLAGGDEGAPILDVRCLTTYWVDIVAHQSGLQESEWRTDVVVSRERANRTLFSGKSVTRGPTSVEFILHTTDGDFTMDSTIVPGGQGVFEDIVGLFDYEGKGALEIRSDVPLAVSSRVYNDNGAGTTGAQARAYRSSDCLKYPDAGWLFGLRQVEGEYRTNISVTNISTNRGFGELYLYGSDGTAIGYQMIYVEPGSVVQYLQPFKKSAGRPNVGWGFARVTGAGLLASATVIDSRTNDPVVVQMVR